MTKKFIKLLIAGFITISVLSGCSGTITSTEIEITPEPETKPGAYEVYYTDSSEDYLNFLNKFNEEKYEIIDISYYKYSWYVTYKIKE